jgi:cob(I)alamin adenosyltransferase
MKSKITTKVGDNGESMALSGQWLSKADPIMECVGCVDELRAHTAQLRLSLLAEGAEELASLLEWLMHLYFVVGSACSDPLEKHPERHPARLVPEHLQKLEAEQMRLEEQLSLPDGFILCATTPCAAQADVTATVARRLERAVVCMMDAQPEFRSGLVIAFVNRLSDYLYVLARYIEDGLHHTVDYNVLGD